MAQRRGPRRDIAAQRNLGQGRRGLLDPWEGASNPVNQQSVLGSQSSVLAQLGMPTAQAAITNSLLSTLLGRSELNQLQSILALSAAQRVGQQLSSDLQPTYGSLNRGRLFNEGVRSRQIFSKRLTDRKKANSAPRSRNTKEDNKDGGGSRDQNHTDDSKRNSTDGQQKKKKTQESNDGDEEVTPYAGIPTESFYCHVCGKRMWDDTSFSNHVKGRAHLSLMDLREQFYKIQVDQMRHELKLAESLRSIEMDRKRRRGKAVRPLAQEYCTMCDLHFFGNIVGHRKLSSHQALKKFLHPCCNYCDKEFHTRIEWDEHRLSPEHMKKCPEAGEDFKLDPTIELDDFDVDEKAKSEVLGDDPPAVGGIAAMIRRLVPKFNPDAGFAPKMVIPVEGFECRRCKFFFNDEETADLHCKTKTHFDRCVAYDKRKARRALRFKPAKKPRDDDEEEVKDASDGGEDAPNDADDSVQADLETSTGETGVLDENTLLGDDEDSDEGAKIGKADE